MTEEPRHWRVHASRAHGLPEMLRQWRAGATCVAPARSGVKAYVDDDVLYLRRPGLETLPVGLPAGRVPNWGFWYLVTAMRRRLGFRERLETMHGIPCLPHELFQLLLLAKNKAAADAVDRLTNDVTRDDEEMLQHIFLWVLRGLPAEKRSVQWRRHLVLLRSALVLEHRVRGQLATTTVASDRKPGGLTLLAHGGRSPDVLWLRDAVYVAVGRLLGKQELPKGYGVTAAAYQQGGLVVAVPRMSVRPIPTWPFG